MKTVPVEIAEQLAVWRTAWHRWLAHHYVLGSVATISTALLALMKEQPTILGWFSHDFLAVVAVVTSGLTVFGRVKEQAGGYLRAFRKLNAARIRFINDQAFGVEKLLTVHEECENLIEGADAV